MRQGIVKWYNERKGLGLIVPIEDYTGGVLVLSPAIAAPSRVLRPGERVTYDLDPERPRLARVVIHSR